MDSEASFLRAFLCQEKLLYLELRVCMNLLRIFKKGENKITRMSFLEDVTDDHCVLSKGTVLIPMYCVLALLFSCPQAESCFFPLLRFSQMHCLVSERKVLRYFF